MLDAQTALDAVAEDRRRRELIRRLIKAIETGTAVGHSGDLDRIHELTSPERPESAQKRWLAAGAGM